MRQREEPEAMVARMIAERAAQPIAQPTPSPRQALGAPCTLALLLL
jgi:hypothetical protein